MENIQEEENITNDKVVALAQYKKEYYKANKEKQAKKLYAKETCPCCGKKVNHQHITDHQKTARCIKKRDETIEMLTRTKAQFKKLNLFDHDEFYDNLIKRVMNIHD